MSSSVTKTPHENFCLNIAKAMSSMKDTPEFVEFDVEVEEKIFSGHSFILLSFSEFFISRFTSNLKDNQEKLVRLSNISATTFQLILDTLNTRGDTLTFNNIIDMWYAVNQLKIAVLIEYCEDFVMTHVSINCLRSYKDHANNLKSKRVHTGILKFFMLNFSALRETELFLRLKLEDVIQVIESDELVIASEDLVLYSVYAWVSYGDVLSEISRVGSVANQDTENERKIHLAQLLQCTRYCLATKWCIIKLHQHKLTLNDTKAKDILFKASSFKLLNYYTLGFWPSAAIHRDSMGLEHVCAYISSISKEFMFISLKTNTLFCIINIATHTSTRLANHGDCLHLCMSNGDSVKVLKIQKNIWASIYGSKIGCWDKCLFFLSHEDSIYIFTRTKVRRFKTNDKTTKCFMDSYSIASPQHALSFHNNILVFASLDKGSEVEETAVHCLNTDTNVWTMLDNITFSSKYMASFKDDTDTYILDCGGNLWKLTDSENLGFAFVAKLWDSKLRLTGAAMYRKTLYVYVDDVATTDGVNLDIGQANLVFSELKFYGTGYFISSNVVHCVVGKEMALNVTKVD